MLGYSNATKAIIMHVEDDDKVMLMIEAQSQNGTLVKTKTAIINESGLYAFRTLPEKGVANRDPLVYSLHSRVQFMPA